MTSSMASSTSSDRRCTYDVFLSYRSVDTRKNFTANLYDALRRKGINTYDGDLKIDLKIEENISSALLKAIEESRVSIIVLSQNYASSQWCLDELTKILECMKTKGQRLLPVFYKVDLSDVRHQRKSFGKAFAKHEKRFKDDQMKVQRWRAALGEVANLAGWHLENGNEATIIEDIVREVSRMLPHTYFPVGKRPLIGIKSRVLEINSLLSIDQMDDIRMVGILGAGGIGKTTIAEAIYDSMAYQFEGSCFLENVREACLVRLQNTLLSKILGHTVEIDSVDEGITLIKKMLCSKRILLILDDVDQLVQLDKLAGEVDWFGLGSRIIITTRDKKVLTNHGVVDSIYKVKELDYNEALELFCWNAFEGPKPHSYFVKVIEDAVCYCGGLPLALIELGSILNGRDIGKWESALDRYKIISLKNIQAILKRSYDGLHENSKNIFLDIACFFKGENVEYVTKILDSCGLRSCSGIEELMDKCLITQSCGSLMMHDLLQEMGREIVRQESPKQLGNRTRLWFHEDVRRVLEDNTGTNNVEGILIDLPEADLIQLSSKAFMEMKRLRLFICRNACFSKELNFLPEKLRLLYWPKYPEDSLPSNFRGKNLAVLRMPNSHLKGLEGIENFQNLTIMNFTDCEFLKRVPDVSRISNLETLILDSCVRLVEVHRSVGFLYKLVDLSLKNCYDLRSFPKSLKLRYLESLVLCGCSSLKYFPEIECQMECLEYIDFQYTGIEKLPSSIGYLVGVKKLYLSGCRNLTNLPDSIYQLQHLERLILKGCTRIKKLPSSIRYLVRVKTLDLGSCTNLTYLPNSIYQLQHLEQLDLNDCSKVIMFPDDRQSIPSIATAEESEISSRAELAQLFPDSNDVCSSISFPKLQRLDLRNCALSESNFFSTFDCGSVLNRLDLSGSDIVALPPLIKRFVGLKFLYLNECKQLQEIQGLPPNVVEVSARGCASLTILLWTPFQLLDRWDPLESAGSGTSFPTIQSSIGICVVTKSDFPFSLKYLDLSSSAIVSFPTWFNRFVGLKRLILEDCKQLREISELPPNLGAIYARGCKSLERIVIDIVYNPQMLPRMLEWIDLVNCHELDGDVLEYLSRVGRVEDHKFACVFPGSTIPLWLDCSQEVSNSNSCEVDINELAHLDGEIISIGFFAVIGTKADIPDVLDGIDSDGQDEDTYGIIFQVICDGVKIYYFVEEDIRGQFHSDHVWLHYSGPEYLKLKGDNLQLQFKLRSASMFFKRCGFHLKKGVQLSKRHHDDDDDDDDGDNMKSNWYPQQKRHKISDAEDTTLGE